MIFASLLNLTSTIGIFELFWSLVALFGIFLSVSAAFESKRDWEVLRLSDNPELENLTHKLVARANIIREWQRAYVQLVFFIIGLIAMASPPPHEGSANGSIWARLFIGVIFVSAELSIIFTVFSERLNRHRIIVELDKELNKNGKG